MKSVLENIPLTIFILGFSLGMTTPAWAETIAIEVFTATQIEHEGAPGATIEYYALDAPDRLQETLPSFGNNEAVASQRAQAWLEQHGEQFASDMKAAQQGRIKSLQYQLTHLPAIVFEGGQYVVYGTTDVPKALAQYYAKGD